MDLFSTNGSRLGEKNAINKMKKQEMDTQEKRKQFLLLDKNSFAASHSKSLL